MAAHRVTVDQVIEGRQTGGRLVEWSGRDMVRGRGMPGRRRIRRRRDPHRRGTPLRVGDVASVTFGPELRRGITDLNGEGDAISASW